MTVVRGFLNRRGASTIFVARFVGFLRPLAPFAAGAVGMPYRPFLVFNALGAVAWGGAAVGAGYLFGEPAERLLRGGGLGIAALVVAVALAFVAGRRVRRSATAPAPSISSSRPAPRRVARTTRGHRPGRRRGVRR